MNLTIYAIAFVFGATENDVEGFICIYNGQLRLNTCHEGTK